MAVASPAAAQAPSAELEALHLPDAWATSTGEGIEVAVLAGADPEATAAAVQAAAPDADVVPVEVSSSADQAVAIDDAVQDGASVIVMFEFSGGFQDETVLRSMEAALDAGVLVVAYDLDGVLPDDLPAIVVGPDNLSGGSSDVSTSTAYVGGIAALLAGQVAPAEAAEILANTADGEDHLVNAEAAVDIAANLAAGGAGLPPPEDRTGGIPPWLVGALAFGTAGLVVGGTIWFASRPPKASRVDR